MSQPEFVGEQEVDFGRYWVALVRYWWIPVAGLVIGAVVGLVVQSGSGSRGYRADTTIYLGQPFAPGSTTAIQSLPTRVGFVQGLISSKAVLKAASAKSGIPLGKLTGAVSQAGIGSTGSTRQTSSPAVQVISVRNASARKAVTASTAVAEIAVKEFSTYVDIKLGSYKTRLARTERELASVDERIRYAEEQQAKALADRSLPATERLIVLANFDNVLQFNETKRANLEVSQLSLGDSIALAQQVERARVIEPASAHRIAPPSKRTGAAVGLVIGLVLGLLGAVLFEPFSQLVKRARTAS